ncbi:MAG TPA: hypothetical protein VD969_18775 [Symbiobacteriaceae bacterium]|nr:hypothetical protein [Symbiobacteriaceae bacterium]
MSNLHRLQWIDAQIRAHRYPNAKGLAAEFEISRRQALRDFEYLRDSLGAPLTYSAQHRGFTYSSEAFTLPGPYVTAEQRTFLGRLAAYYSDVARHDARAAGTYATMAALLERLGGGGAAAPPPVPMPAPIRPFRAILQRQGGAPPTSLEPYWRGDCHFEFTDPRAFLCALLTSWMPCRIEWPLWLREQLEAYLQKTIAVQNEVTRHVTTPLVSSPRPTSSERMIPMTKRIETPARYEPNWTSYAGATYGVLKAAGMLDQDHDWFMGVSGMAFHLIMHEDCCISSATVYDWDYEHRAALERMGVLSEVLGAMPDSPTFDAACKRAVANIKASLDRGVGVVVWGIDTGEFGVIYGYDDDDGVFLADGVGKFGPGSNPVLYENIGRTFGDAPILHYQIPIERVAVDLDKAYRSSLQYYVRHMESQQHVCAPYQAGIKAYDNWIGALERGKFQSVGLLYNLTVYASAKWQASHYMQFLAESWRGLPALAETADLFERIAGVYKQMLDAAGHDLHQPPFMWPEVTPDQAAALLPLVRQARALEVEAVTLVKAALA